MRRIKRKYRKLLTRVDALDEKLLGPLKQDFHVFTVARIILQL
jgi:hypothetical protein